MRRSGAPRVARCLLGALVGAGVFATSSVAVFSLVASADTSPLNAAAQTLLGSSGGSGSNTSTSSGSSGGSLLQAPQNVICGLNVCGTPTQSPPSTSPPPAPSLPNCISGLTCAPTPCACPNPGGPTPQPSSAGPSPEALGGITTGGPSGGTGEGGGGAGSALVGLVPSTIGPVGTQGILVQPPPASITLANGPGGINFGKAPFLWPLFLALDFLGVAAVVLVVRKTWSRSVAD
ncbi:MAG: hypothetical protein ABR498_02180 [Candidatus Dormibacteria bacterium]